MSAGQKVLLIVGITVVIMGIGTLIRYLTHTGVFKRKNDTDSKNKP